MLKKVLTGLSCPQMLSLFAVHLLFLVSATWVQAQDVAAFEEKTTLHVLTNGWTFIIVERPTAPVFSFSTHVNVGSTREVPGITGLAHMFEHMAFKGTPHIGTSDFEGEKKALEAMEVAYQTYQRERLSLNSDPEKLKRFFEEFKGKQEEAAQYVVKNEFGDIIDREGGTGLNAYTSSDTTGYFYSLPANKTELFAYLESERFLHPVFREFYRERDVVQEERRLRTESGPTGRLIEQFLSASFIAHPYHQPVVGYMSDLKSLTITDAENFYRTFYVPANMVTAIVGDVKARDLIPLLEKYFGRIPVGRNPDPLRTIEPPQIAEKIVVLKDPAQPFYIEGYHKGSMTHPDQPVYEAIDDILSRGRTSRLYRSLVRDQKIAVSVRSFSSFPGRKFPNLWTVLAVPARGNTNEEVRGAIHLEIDRLRREEVSDEELSRFKTRAKADLIRSLRNNQGLANRIADYQAIFGDWRELFRYIDRLDQVSKADIQRVVNQTFQENNRTVAMIVTEKRSPSGSGAAKAQMTREGD